MLGSISSAVAKDVVVPVKDTVGVKLMRLMGWREGQGIGPRSKKTGNSADIHADEHLFAPKEISVESLKVKRDQHGLGYNASVYAPETRIGEIYSSFLAE